MNKGGLLTQPLVFGGRCPPSLLASSRKDVVSRSIRFRRALRLSSDFRGISSRIRAPVFHGSLDKLAGWRAKATPTPGRHQAGCIPESAYYCTPSGRSPGVSRESGSRNRDCVSEGTRERLQKSSYPHRMRWISQ